VENSIVETRADESVGDIMMCYRSLSILVTILYVHRSIIRYLKVYRTSIYRVARLSPNKDDVALFSVKIVSPLKPWKA
jgi:hypothetical protein